MSEFDAPLAQSEDWAVFSDSPIKFVNSDENDTSMKEGDSEKKDVTETFTEPLSGSLEDLVNSFDEKITKCFVNYDEQTDKIAPVQIRSQEEFINECQIWWNLTGNFGNVPTVDWTKSKARKLQLPVLNLNKFRGDQLTTRNGLPVTSCDEDELSKDLDLHSLIISSLNHEEDQIVVSVDDVLEEIDDMMQEGTFSSATGSTSTAVSTPSSMTKSPDECHTRHKFSTPAMMQNLRSLSTSQLNEYHIELERIIQDYSSTLIQELALRDELEYEKELKNTFISLLLTIQNRKRQLHLDRKKGKANQSGPKFLTTVIPFDPQTGPVDMSHLQVLIKILKAINEDSPTVPTLLTDYILKVLCPN